MKHGEGLIMVQIRNRGKRQYKAFILKQVSEGYERIGTVKVDITKDKFTFKDKTFVVEIQQNAFVDNDKVYLFYDYDKGNKLSFVAQKQIIDSKMLDDLITKGIIGQLVTRLKSALGGEKGTFWITVIFGVIMGVGIGIVVGQQAFPKEVIRYIIQNSSGTFPQA
jgi:hypothetical protein